MEMMLLHIIKNDLSIIEFKEGYIKIQEVKNNNISKQDIKAKLISVTGFNWVIESDNLKKGINYGEQENMSFEKRKQEVINHELVQKTLKSFSEIEIDAIKLSNIDNK
jgi:hypothetical protein